jgi:hypothetical protein
MDLGHFVLNPATLLVLIFGLVEYVKGFGIHGNGLRAISLALGVALAQLTTARKLHRVGRLDRDSLFRAGGWPVAASGIRLSQGRL